eukprot:9500697-Pyramimonas_sp.AAC.3
MANRVCPEGLNSGPGRWEAALWHAGGRGGSAQRGSTQDQAAGRQGDQAAGRPGRWEAGLWRAGRRAPVSKLHDSDAAKGWQAIWRALGHIEAVRNACTLAAVSSRCRRRSEVARIAWSRA